MTTKVTIIANFYNSRKFIPKLLRSVAGQTYRDWHLICIDDCSPENDSDTIKEWCAKLKITDKVTIIRNQENLGISKAKEAGIKYVCSHFNKDGYTTFIDGDDWLEPNALGLLYNEAATSGAEVIISNYNHVYKLGPLQKKKLCRIELKPEEYNFTFNHNQAIDRLLINFLGVNLYHPAYWGKLYKNELLDRLDFEFPSKEKSAYEDFFWLTDKSPWLRA